MPRILQWIQVRFGNYLHRLVVRGIMDATAPDFDELQRLINETPHGLPTLPRGLITPTRPPTGTGTGTGGQGGSGGTGTQPGGRGGGVVTNPRVTHAWRSAFESSNKMLADIRSHAPTTQDRGTGQQVDVCLSYHLRGTCFKNCTRRSTHRTLAPLERTRMNQFVGEHCTPAAGSTTGSSGATTGSGGAPK